MINTVPLLLIPFRLLFGAAAAAFGVIVVVVDFTK